MSVDELELRAANPQTAQQNSADASLDAQIAAGAKLIVYQYVISLVFVSFKRRSSVRLVQPGQRRVVPGLPHSILSLFAGIWGIFGFAWTIESIIHNCRGGVDLTPAYLARRRAATAPAGTVPAGNAAVVAGASSDYEAI